MLRVRQTKTAHGRLSKNTCWTIGKLMWGNDLWKVEKCTDAHPSWSRVKHGDVFACDWASSGSARFSRAVSAHFLFYYYYSVQHYSTCSTRKYRRWYAKGTSVFIDFECLYDILSATPTSGAWTFSKCVSGTRIQ